MSRWKAFCSQSYGVQLQTCLHAFPSYEKVSRFRAILWFHISWANRVWQPCCWLDSCIGIIVIIIIIITIIIIIMSRAIEVDSTRWQGWPIRLWLCSQSSCPAEPKWTKDLNFSFRKTHYCLTRNCVGNIPPCWMYSFRKNLSMDMCLRGSLLFLCTKQMSGEVLKCYNWN